MLPLTATSTSVGNSAIDLISIVLESMAPVVAGSLTTLLGISFKQYMSDRNDLVQNVYSPMFDTVSSYSEGDLVFEEESSQLQLLSDQFSPSELNQIDKEVREKVLDMNNSIETLNRFLRNLEMEIQENGRYRRGSGGGILMSSQSIKPSIIFKMSTGGGHVQGYTLWRWLSEYAASICNSTTVEELRSELKQRAEEIGPECANVIDSFGDEELRQIGQSIENAVEETEFEQGIETHTEQYTRLMTVANETQDMIKQEIDMPWYKYIIQDML
jgi:hypothetical protein